MCYAVQIKATKLSLQDYFKAKMNGTVKYQAQVSAFDNPQVPVILDTDSKKIELAYWGLIPSWYKTPETIRQKTNNARYDELLEKRSYKEYASQRCLILVTGFYEYKHLIGGGKQMYLLTAPKNEPFAIGGIWSTWTDPETSVSINTFSMLTEEARGIMRDVHNNGLRQPLMLQKGVELDWLMSDYNANDVVPDFELVATKFGKEPAPTLFDEI